MAIPFKVNLRSMFERRTATLLTVLGVGLPIMVLVALGALSAGLSSVFTATGEPQHMMVMRGAALSEMESYVDREDARILGTMPQIAPGTDGQPTVSAETVIIVNQRRRGPVASDTANMIVRGVSAAGYRMRPQWKLVEGRMPAAGVNELVSSRAMASRFQDCGLGETLVLRRKPFKVVGIFEADGTAYDSEVWTDVDDLSKTFNREGYSSLLVRIDDAAARQSFVAAVAGDTRLQQKVMGQREYFEKQTASAIPIQVLVGIMTTVLSVGAVFAASNTMYAAVANRTREIGTLRALGFSRGAIVAGYMAESLALSLLAGVVGCLLGAAAVSLFTGYSGTTNFTTFSEVAFAFKLTPRLIANAMFFAAVVGLIGGVLPALRAARMPVTVALRKI